MIDFILNFIEIFILMYKIKESIKIIIFHFIVKFSFDNIYDWKTQIL